MGSRLASLIETFDSLGIDAMLVSDEVNVRYLSGFTGDSSSLVVTGGGTTILSDGRYETQISEQCPELATAIRPPQQRLGELTAEFLRGLGATRIGIEASAMTLSAFRELSEQCDSLQLVETSGVVERLRMIKDADEIETTRKAIRIAERAFQAVHPMLTPACQEREIAHRLEACMRELGAHGCSFDPIVAVGPAGALPHYQPAGVVIGDESTLLIDWGASYEGYASDLTRTLHRATASEAFRRAYEAVLEAQQAAIETIAAGVETHVVDAAARKVLSRHGLNEAFKHGLGHGIGLQIHEAPRIAASAVDTLASGMIVTVEPGVYFEGEFGIRIEDDVLVTDRGCEVLSSLPKGLDDSRVIL